jgi:hypothetical protein
MRALLLSVALASLVTQDAATLDLKERPVSKVIRLLKDMQAALEKEKADDESLREKMECWCETNEKDKNTAIDTANSRIDGLVSDIGKHSGKSAELEATIKQVEKELAANIEALDTATEVRAKEREEFNASEKDMMQAIGALKNAVLVLSKHHGESFLQSSAVDVRHVVETVLAAKLGASKSARKLQALLAQPNANAGSYVPASGQIFGILKQMKEEFESNLSQSQKDEIQAQEEFVALREAKRREIQAGKDKSKELTFQKADTDDALAQAKEDLGMTRDALSSDTAFLGDLRLRCQQSDKDWTIRSKTRSEEIAAVGEAISILSDDDAFDLFGKTVNSFVQTRADSTERKRAAGVLRALGKKTGNLHLLALSSAVQLDAFVKVKKAIDDMTGALKAEQADEVKHRDFCVDEQNKNEVQTAKKEREIKELSTLIENSEHTIAEFTKDIEGAHAAIKEVELQMKKAGEDRELENQNFQTVVTEQRATQAILHKALDRLSSFYNKKSRTPMPSLVQQEPGAAAPPPPPAHKEYKKSAGSGGVMQLIQNVIDESAAGEKEAIEAEADSQAGYEEFIKNSNAAIAASNQEIAAKTGEKAETEGTKVQAEGDRVAALADAEQLSTYKGELHQSCDFVLKNFDTRQAARQAEIDGLAQAKAILSGSDFS